jgi:hypothetical protein
MKNDALKKHHFWILAGVGPFFALLAALLVWSNVGDEIQAKTGTIDKKLKEVKGTSPKGKIALEKGYPAQKEELLKKRKELWQVQWDKQRELFAWPKDPSGGLQQLEKQYVKFGTTIPNVDALENFTKKDVYEAAYEEVATIIRPTTFPGGRWQSVLRYVSNWPKRPDSKQVWLALEDLWVQKGLLMPVKAINDEAAKFELVRPAGADGKPTEPPPLKRTFVSRVWRLDLEVPTTGPKANKVVLARLTNRTGRLQTFGPGPRGRGHTLWLRIKLSDNGQPINYLIESEGVKGGGVINITADTVNPRLQGILAGTDIQKIVEVTQVLDEPTAPVRMVKNIELGQKDSRHFPATLKTVKFLETPEGSADATATGMTGTSADYAGSMGSSAGGPVGPGGPMMPGGPAGAGGRGPRRSKTGTPELVLNANKDRYLETTDQVRRMPVAVVLIVDQMFLQDALVAYANSPLRFQITQYHWARFRGQLPTTSGSPGGGGFFGGEMMAGGPVGPGGPGIPGSVGGEAEMPADETGVYGLPGSGGGYAGSMGSPPSLPSGFGPPGGDMAGPGGYGMGGYPGGFGGMFGGGGSTAAQNTSGLVELSIYGIVTLYEKYEDKSADGAAGTATPPGEATAPAATPPVPDTTTAPPTTPPAPGAITAPAPPAPNGTPAAPAPAAGTPMTTTGGATPAAGSPTPKAGGTAPATPPDPAATPPAPVPPKK